MDAPPCTQIIAKSVAGIAIFDFFMPKNISFKRFWKEVSGINKLLFYTVNREIHHIK